MARTFSLLLPALFILVAPLPASAQDTACGIQWGADVQISLDPPPGWTSGRIKLAVQGDTIHAIWNMTGPPPLRIPYRRSTSDGRDWEPVRDIIGDTVSLPWPAAWHWIVATDTRLAVVFSGGNANGITPLQYIFSMDRGNTWTLPAQAIPGDSALLVDHAAMTGDTIAVLYRRRNTGGYPAIVRTTNAGASWSIAGNYSGGGGGGAAGTLAFTPGHFFFIHTGPGAQQQSEVVVNRSTDLGTTWMDTTFLSVYDDYPADLPFAASWVDGAGGSFVAAVWRDGGIGVGGGGFGGGIAFASTTDNGATWTSPPQALTIRHNGYTPRVAVRGDIIVAAWSAILDTTDHVNFRWSSDRGITWSTVCDIAPGAVVAVDPAVGISENAIHIAWMEERDSLWNLFYKRGTLPPSSVKPAFAGTPAGVRLHRNYPNPFNPSTTIPFDLPERGEAKLVVFDILGREVATLVNGVMEAGRHRIVWDAGTRASGVYVCRLTLYSANRSRTTSIRMMLAR